MQFPDISNLHEDQELKVTKLWNVWDNLPKNCVEQFEEFKKYLNGCKSIGVFAAEKKLGEDEDEIVSDVCVNERSDSNIFCTNIRESLQEIDKNKDQVSWLNSFLSYFYMLYFPNPSILPEHLKTLLK